MTPKAKKTRTLAYDDIFRLREASDPQMSPDGTTVAFVVGSADKESDENRHSIWTAKTDGGDPVQLTQGKNDFHPRWSPDGDRLAFLRAEDGLSQIWLLPTAGGEARKLTSLPLGAGGFAWSPDSTRLAVVAATDLEGTPDDHPDVEKEKERRRNAPMVIRSATFKADGAGLIGSLRSHLYVVDADTGEAEALTKGDISVATPAWSPDSKRIAFVASTEDRDVTARTHMFVVGADGGEPDEVVGWGGTAVAPFFSRDGETPAFVGSPDPGPGHSRLYSAAPDGGEPNELAPGFDRNVMIGGPAYPGALPLYVGEQIVFCARDRGCTNAYTLSDGEVKKIVGDEEHVVSGLSSAPGLIAYVVSSPEIPADVFVAALDGSGERRLTDLNRELLDEVKLHRCEPRTFKAPDGLEIHGWIIKGDGPKPQPLLVDVHGGPHNAWSPALDPVHIYHEQLAAEGWTILRLNPRGSDGYGEDFMTAVVAAWGEIDENDFLSAIDTLVDEGLADPDRVAVCGYSYGGHMTNWLTGRHPDRFAAAVSGGCLSNITSFYGNSDAGFWMGKFEMGAEQYEARDRFAELSPLSYVENVKTPTLVLHGENDDRCPVGQAEEWFVSLRRLGVESEFVRYPGGSHLFILSGRPSHRIDYNERIADWVTRHCAK